jgi:hypothetical protein
MRMRLRLAVMSAIATLAMAVGLTVGFTTGANAITSAHQTVAAKVAATPDTPPCSFTAPSGAAFQFWNGANQTGDTWYCRCTPGNDYSSGFLTPVKSFVNHCGTKVWMQEFVDGGSPPHGWSYCISPGEAKNDVGMTYWHPASFLIGRESGSC